MINISKQKIRYYTIRKIKTPLGIMTAGAVKEGVCLLEFAEEFEKEKTDGCLIGEKINDEKISAHFEALGSQLSEYFNGKRKKFSLPLVLNGTEFQMRAWHTLLRVPYGETISYEKQAALMKNPKAVRAAANANAANKIGIIIPCHRVIAKNGGLAGYAAGIEKKEYLLNLEKI
ncbi:MAG: methylated-DNA--[protein]-cysteine S-methyltransferase [Spirochaetia bacterium]|nr:methylated-DNA--[protein]-cysteine S-methyltransferase [Spirochaetia bacterium]